MLNELHDASLKDTTLNPDTQQNSQDYLLGLKTSPTDLNYICRLVGLIIRQEGISTITDKNVYNVYDHARPVINEAILDSKTVEIGEYLIKRFVARNELFGCTRMDEPNISDVSGPKDLLSRVKKCKSTTIRRTGLNLKPVNKSERDVKEEQRKKIVKKETKRVECLSSEMNACQAIVKPDCSKPKVMKSTGIKNTLGTVLQQTINKMESSNHTDQDVLLEKMILCTLVNIVCLIIYHQRSKLLLLNSPK